MRQGSRNDLLIAAAFCGALGLYDLLYVIFLLSGGVTAKTRTVPLPSIILGLLDGIDAALCAVAPRIFAMGRIVALRRHGATSAGATGG